MPRVDIDFVGNDQTGGITDPVISSFTELQSAIALVERGLGYAKRAFDETVGATVSYADEIRSLQQVTGGSAEETSKLIQVLDDYKVSSQSAMLAQRSLTKQGIVLTTESLAELSKRYLEITDQADRNAFAQKNLGRSYKDFIEVLQQGPDAINGASDAVEKNLILTQKAVDEARLYQMQMDNLGDAFMGFKIKAGADALPVVTSALKNFTEEMNKSGLAGAAFKFGFDDIIKAFIDGRGPIDTSSVAMKGNAAAMGDEADAAAGLAEQQKAAADALNAMTTANNGMMSLMTNVKAENDNYAKSQTDLQAKNVELQTNLQTLNAQGWWPTSEAVQDATNKLRDNEQAIKDLDAAHEAAMRKIAYNLFLTKLQADGFTDAEFKVAIQAGITAGVIDQKSADMALAMDKAATAAFDMHTELDTAEEAARRLAGEYVVNIKTIYATVGTPGPTGGGVIHARATGGAASGMTLVGERGPELVNLPGGSRVYSNQDSRNMMSGGGMTVNLNIASGGVIADPQEFARQITPALKYALRDMGVK